MHPSSAKKFTKVAKQINGKEKNKERKKKKWTYGSLTQKLESLLIC